MKKIALVHDFLTAFGGAERVLVELAKIFKGAPIFTLTYDREAFRTLLAGREIIIPPASFLPQRSRLGSFPRLIESFDLSRFDLVISNSNSFAHGVRVARGATHIVYCHSPARYLWDYNHEYLKEEGLDRGLRGLVLRVMLHRQRVWDIEASTRPTLYLANSRNVKTRIEKYYRRKSLILYPPIDLLGFHPTEKKEDFFLIVSRLSAYKKIDLAIEVFNRLPYRLLIVGEGRDRARLESLRRSRKIEFLGFQKESEKNRLLAKARALIHPQEEDFGLTPLEAFASGTPVVAYKKGGAIETVNRKTGLFFEIQSPEALNLAIKRFLEVEESFLEAELVKRAEEFEIGRFKSGLEKIIQGLVGEKIG